MSSVYGLRGTFLIPFGGKALACQGVNSRSTIKNVMERLLVEACDMIAASVIRRRLGIWNYGSWEVARNT